MIFKKIGSGAIRFNVLKIFDILLVLRTLDSGCGSVKGSLLLGLVESAVIVVVGNAGVGTGDACMEKNDNECIAMLA